MEQGPKPTEEEFEDVFQGMGKLLGFRTQLQEPPHISPLCPKVEAKRGAGWGTRKRVKESAKWVLDKKRWNHSLRHRP